MAFCEALVLHKRILAQSGLVILTKYYRKPALQVVHARRPFAIKKITCTKGLLEKHRLLALRRALLFIII